MKNKNLFLVFVIGLIILFESTQSLSQSQFDEASQHSEEDGENDVLTARELPIKMFNQNEDSSSVRQINREDGSVYTEYSCASEDHGCLRAQGLERRREWTRSQIERANVEAQARQREAQADAAQARANAEAQQANGALQACRQAGQQAGGFYCSGQELAPLAQMMANGVNHSNLNQANMKETCEKAKQINQIATAGNGLFLERCRSALSQCVQICQSAASQIESIPKNILVLNSGFNQQANHFIGQLRQGAYEAQSIAQDCNNQRTHYTQRGIAQLAQNALTLVSSRKCADALGPADNPLDPNNNASCRESLPANLHHLCPSSDRMADLCQEPEHQNRPYCQSFTPQNLAGPSHIATPPGFCKENPQLCDFRNGQLQPNIPNNRRGLASTGTDGIDGGFDPTSLGLVDPDNPTPLGYTGNGDLQGGGSPGLAVNGAGGGGGGLGGGGGGYGGGSAFPGGEDYAGGADGIYDTDILKGVGGGTAATGVGNRQPQAVNAGAFNPNTSIKGLNLKRFNPKDYLPGGKKYRNIDPKTGYPYGTQITPANGPSNWEKVSRIYRSKRRQLLGEDRDVAYPLPRAD